MCSRHCITFTIYIVTITYPTRYVAMRPLLMLLLLFVVRAASNDPPFEVPSQAGVEQRACVGAQQKLRAALGLGVLCRRKPVQYQHFSAKGPGGHGQELCWRQKLCVLHVQFSVVLVRG